MKLRSLRPRAHALPLPAAASALLAATALAGVLAGCAGGAPTPAALPTLDGRAPLVIAHRGLPGLYPEETRIAYEAAADAGADSLEEDLHLTKDCVLVVRHNPWLSDNTDVAEVAKTNPAVAARKRTVPGVKVKVAYPAVASNGPAEYLSDLTNPADPKSVLKSLIVDGEDHTNDWSISDFTMAELRTWIKGTTYDARDERPTELNGKVPVISFQDVIDIAREKSRSAGRLLTVYPESKNPIWNDAQAIANGCGPAGSHPLEDAIIAILEKNGLNAKDAPVFVQSFDPASLKYLRRAGLKTRAVQLMDGNGVDFRTGELIFNTMKESTFSSGRPWSWTLAGDPRWFDAMLTPAGLAEVKTYADGIGPWKPELLTWKVQPWKERNADGSPYAGALRDASVQAPNAVIADAHRAGLFVHVFTFRNEKKYLAGGYVGDPQAEYLAFFRAGIDGVFTDFTPTAFAARQVFLREAGR